MWWRHWRSLGNFQIDEVVVTIVTMLSIIFPRPSLFHNWMRVPFDFLFPTLPTSCSADSLLNDLVPLALSCWGSSWEQQVSTALEICLGLYAFSLQLSWCAGQLCSGHPSPWVKNPKDNQSLHIQQLVSALMMMRQNWEFQVNVTTEGRRVWEPSCEKASLQLEIAPGCWHLPLSFSERIRWIGGRDRACRRREGF